MSESQKWITSISGAVVGQIAVLAFFYLLVVNPMSPNLVAKAAKVEPREVTVMLSQIMEQAREELPDPEPEQPEPEPAEETMPEPPAADDIFSNQRQYVNTDSNTARQEAPETSRFESDRNTTASTEFLPNPDLPQTAGPTMRGDDQIKSLSLSNQNYADGEIQDNPTPPPSASQPPSPPTEEAPPAEEMKDTPPSENEEETEPVDPPADEMTEGEADEAKPGDADTPPEEPAEKLIQPEAETMTDEALLATTTKSFIDPTDSTDAMPLPNLEGETDQQAAAIKETEETGEPTEQEEKKEIKATPVVVGESMDKIKEKQAAAVDSAVRKELDESMFNPAYLAFRRKNNQNGDITTIGEGSVDAMATATGKYKRQVEQAIGRKWHQYRQERAAHVTWGFLRVTFYVTPQGYVRNPVIEKKEATELVTEFSLRAIVDAKIPPMPPDVAAVYGAQGLKMHYNIQIY